MRRESKNTTWPSFFLFIAATRRAAIISGGGDSNNRDRGGGGGGSSSSSNRRIGVSETGGISVNTDGRTGLLRRTRPKQRDPSGSGGPNSAAAVQEVGDDVILNCAADRKVDLCR